jgi:benzoate-CoA ligase
VVEFDAAMAAQSDELEAAPTHRDDVAFWLYSSGSTGKPKGVVHLHHDIEVTCENYAGRVLGLRENDLTFSTTKLFHAYGLGNALSFPLWFGAASVLMRGPTKPEPILAALRRHRPTVFFSVPALFGALLRDPAADGAFDSVRFCVSAAEALPAPTIERWRDRFGLDIVDGIGSTEMLHIYCSNRPGGIEPGTTGRPVPGYELRLVDDRGEVLDGAGIGGLQVRGDSCAAYYWHQHEKTKHSMLGEWFVTGDRYERRADGAYAYVGRVDDMLKVGGLWVSPLDMEHVLMEHPRVGSVGVVGVEIEGASRIAAYVQCDGEPGDGALADELRAWCKERMRRYEYPHLITFVDDLPRTLTGKVQRFRLRDWAAHASPRELDAALTEPDPAVGLTSS